MISQPQVIWDRVYIGPTYLFLLFANKELLSPSYDLNPII